MNAASFDAFRLGYAPKQSALVDAAVKQGYTNEQLVKAGLAAPSKHKPGTFRDYFFDRLMFPIFDNKGIVVAFGGRTLGDGEPKYLNSPETPLFSKSKTLYGLSHGAGAIRKMRKAVLVEGYMDAIAVHQYGLPIACAPLGTALTSDHAVLLGRFTTDVIVVFDADSAGLNAAVRGAELLLSKAFSVRIATVPGAKDPDELLHEKGLPAFEACLKAAVDLVEFKTELLVREQPQPLTPEGKAAVAKQVLATIEQCPDEILKSEWTSRLASRLGVPVAAIAKQGQLVAAAGARRPAAMQAEAAKPGAVALNGQDEELLLHLFKQPRLCAMAQEDDFLSDPARELWKALRAQEPWAGGWTVKLSEGLQAGSQQTLARLLLKLDNLGKDDAEPRVAAILTRRRNQRRLGELERLLRDGQLTDKSLKDEFNRLLVQLKGSPAKA